MYCKKINANCIDNYDEDIKQIQQLENEIRILEQHVLNVENRVRQKAAKLAEYESHLKGFHEDQKFDENFWRELRRENKNTCLCDSIQQNPLDNNLGRTGVQGKNITDLPRDQVIDYFFERLRPQSQ